MEEQDKDLVIGESTEEEAIYVDWNPHEDIAAAFNAIVSVDAYDYQMLNGADKKRVDQIKRWSLRLIHHNLKDIYTDTFGDEE